METKWNRIPHDIRLSDTNSVKNRLHKKCDKRLRTLVKNHYKTSHNEICFHILCHSRRPSWKHGRKVVQEKCSEEFGNEGGKSLWYACLFGCEQTFGRVTAWGRSYWVFQLGQLANRKRKRMKKRREREKVNERKEKDKIFLSPQWVYVTFRSISGCFIKVMKWKEKRQVEDVADVRIQILLHLARNSCKLIKHFMLVSKSLEVISVLHCKELVYSCSLVFCIVVTGKFFTLFLKSN